MTMRRITIAGLALVLALAIAAAAIWYFVIRNDSPPPVSLTEAVAVASSEVKGEAGDDGGEGAETSTSDSAAAADAGGGSQQSDIEDEPETANEASTADETSATDTPTTETSTGEASQAGEQTEPEEAQASGGRAIVGTWSVPDDGSSFAGYRVVEELGGIGTQTAVGRSTDVTGTLVFDGKAVAAVEIEVDMTQLTSDDSRRDRTLRNQGIEWGTYPTATFSLTEPIPIEVVPDEGVPLTLPATGNLTLHGVSREVTIELEGQRVGDRLAIVGSLPIEFADYEIPTPTSFLVVSIEDRGIMEFQLIFESPS